jgi:Bacterial Ig-like domain
VKIFKSFYLLLILATFGCAQVRNPIGGEKDIESPVLIKATPENFSTDFSSKKIILEFNEYLQLKDLATQLIISPPFKEKPLILIKGKRIEITLKDSLSQNTTYNFNFGNAIQDLTESNTIEDFLYVFSTGSYIDSLEFAGKIKDALTSGTEKGIVAMLYNNFEDSVISTLPPNYFAKTKEDGSFRIKYIKPGAYKMIAIKDESNNFLYDFPMESIAFTTDTITPSTLDSNAVLPSFNLYKEIDTTQYIKETVTKGFGFIQFVFNIPNQNFRIEPATHSFKNKDWKIVSVGAKKDTVTIWVPDLESQEDLDLVVYWKSG